MKSKMRDFFQLKVAPFLIAGYVKFLRLTLRISYLDRHYMDNLLKQGKPYIFAFWHQRLIMMMYAYKGSYVHVLISMHRDGLMTSNVLKYFGTHSIQGSSTRGGSEGLRKIIKVTRTGSDLGFTPDGPKGPARKVKPGVIQAARLTGLPIIPVSYGASRKHTLRSWDKMNIPKLFSRLVFTYGKPIKVKRGSSKEDIEKYCDKLEKELNRLSDRADRCFNTEINQE